MLSIARMAAGQGRYYLDLAREDYYLDGGEPPGRWWGDAAGKLGLEGTVTAASLKKLLTGHGPAGEPLVQNAGTPGRRPGFDLTFSAPKSVSVLWAAADEQTRRAIQEAHHAAVAEALRVIQDTAAFVRRGKGGVTRVPAKLAVAIFEHGTSRALEPQLHTHALVMNAALGEDRRFGALDGRELFEIKMTAGAAYRAELSAQLERRLGLESVPKKSWFELKDVPEKLIKIFSSRRGAIELELKSVGLETASAAALATLKTRPVKEVVPPRGELFTSWRETARQHGFSIRQAVALCGQTQKRDPVETVAAISAKAVSGLLSRLTSFTEREYLRAGFEASQGRGVGVAQVRAHVTQHIANPKAFVLDPESGSLPRYSTPEALAARQGLRDLATKMQKGATRRGVPSHLVGRAIRKYASPRSALAGIIRHYAAQVLRAARRQESKPVNRRAVRRFAARSLNREQQKILTLLTRPSAHKLRIVKGSGDHIDILTLAVAVKLWEEAGYKALTLTRTKQIARGLKSYAGIRSATLTAFMHWLKPSLARLVGQHGKQLLRSAIRKPTSRPKKFVIDKKTVIFVHDAHKLGADELSVLVHAAKKGGGGLILLGEPKTLQHENVAAPSQTQDRENTVDSASKPKKKRPRPATPSATPVAAVVPTTTYLDLLREKAAVKQSQDHAAAVNALIADWVRLEGAAPQNSLILCDTKDEARYMNRRAQDARIAADVIDTRQHVTVNDISLYAGDRVQFAKRSRPLGIDKGDLGTVLRIDSARRVLDVRLHSGREVLVPLRDYQAVGLGYAMALRDAPEGSASRVYMLSGDQMLQSTLQAIGRMNEPRIYVHGFPPPHETQNQSRSSLRDVGRTRSASPELAASEGPELAR